jgi:thiol-disulfide isomerase/thioredoxin
MRLLLRLLCLGSLAWCAIATAGELPVRPVELATAAQFRSVLAAEKGKVVVVNFWGTWCTPCLREIPDLVKLESELAPRGLVLLGVAMDEPASLDGLVRPFQGKYFPAFRTLSRNEPDMDTMASVIDPAWNELLPTTYFIDRTGKVVKRIQGKKTLDEFRTLALGLL